MIKPISNPANLENPLIMVKNGEWVKTLPEAET
jgi:hypothetical protein